MSLLGKYRREERDRDEDEEPQPEKTQPQKTSEPKPSPIPVAIPNKERKSPIMSFSVTTDLRSCLQDIRNKRAINLSMWVEKVLREAATKEFPDIAVTHLESG